jgi:Ca2+-binding EF-hand superfamily protein
MHILIKLLDKENSGKIEESVFFAFMKNPADFVIVQKKKKIKTAWGEEEKAENPIHDSYRRILHNLSENKEDLNSLFRFYDSAHNCLINNSTFQTVRQLSKLIF